MNKRVLTPAQIDAARRNGAKFHGPVSNDAKAHSSRNSLRHGLLANSIVIPVESRDRFMTLCANLERDFQPASETESSLIDTMAVCRCHQRNPQTQHQNERRRQPHPNRPRLPRPLR